ncbi:MAG: hypothetical protein NTX64_06040 [Elusimicrobia bacterium]|nr:hypothetical protein [Elusimicrobiota bacterium]
MRRGKGVVALLVLVAVLTGVFVLPGGMRIPWADKVAGKFGFAAPGIGPHFSNLTKAMHNARQEDQTWSIGGLGKRLFARSFYTPPASSSMELVLRKAPETEADARARVGNPQSIAGIIRPEDVAKRDNAVSLSNEEFFGGLVKSANAASMAAGGPMSDGGKMADMGQMAKNLEMAASASPVGDGILGQPSASASASLPRQVAGGKVERLASYSISQSVLSMYQKRPDQASNQTFYQLAWTRAYSVTAAQPVCADSNGCPKEYASNTAGLVFDGGKPGQSGDKIMSNADLGETSPAAPEANNTNVQGIVTESNQYYQDVQDCDAVDAWTNPMDGTTPTLTGVKNSAASAFNGKTLESVCGPSPGENMAFLHGRALSERVLMDEMQHQSCKMNCNLGNPHGDHPECSSGQWQGDTDCAHCDSGSCDKTTATLCKGYGNQMKAVCNQLNCVFKAKHDACPLSATQPLDQHSCNQ